MYLEWANNIFNIKQGLKFSLWIGLFFVSYLTLVEPDKYNVIHISEWILVEGFAGLTQFTLFGVLLGKFVKKSSITLVPNPKN